MAAALLFSACSKNEPFFSAGEDDAPRILNTNIPEYGDDGQPGVIANLASDEAFTPFIRGSDASSTLRVARPYSRPLVCSTEPPAFHASHCAP